MRVRGQARIPLHDGWVASAPAGSIADPSGLSGLTWIETTLPNTAAGALRAAGAWSLDDTRRFDADDWWWRVRLGGELSGGLVLGLEGIATLWDAWVDGAHVASGDSMWRAHVVAIEHPARELVIRCRSLDAELAKKRARPRWRVPMLEQQQLRWIRTTLLGRTPGWSPPCPAVGPWRPLWLEQRSHAITDLAIDARVEHDTGIVDVAVTGLDGATLVVSRGDRRFTATLGPAGGSVAVPEPVLWWPHTHGEPARYHVAIEAQGYTIEVGATGFRTIELDRGDGSDFRLRVNGVPVFCRGACWSPLDPVTLAATPGAIDAAIRQLVDANMNMVRVGGTMIYESDAFHDALDEHGVLLWQDLMFANMDYPTEPEFTQVVQHEVHAQLGRLQARPSLAIVCGNSEGAQQAAMWGATRDRWEPALFHDVIPAIVHARVPRVPYTPSSTSGGAFPHASNAGPSSYYGVGAYLRPLEDARRAEVRFASECLAFANIPAPAAGAELRTPRDLGASWDFHDVRDHYVRELYRVDPAALRISDHARYLALGRAATGEVMARTFAEWRRARSQTGGGLIWFLRDLWPGAGWGVVDARGIPKPAWYVLRRALAPVSVAFTDEGTNGLALHLTNDGNQPLDGKLELALWRGDVSVGRAALDVAVPAHGARELAPASLFDGWFDLSYAYRFGPPVADVIHARLAGDFVPCEAFWFPAGLPATREPDVGLAAKQTGDWLVVSSRRAAQHVTIDLPGWLPADDHFHLAPGQARTIALRETGAATGPGTVTALNSDLGATIETA